MAFVGEDQGLDDDGNDPLRLEDLADVEEVELADLDRVDRDEWACPTELLDEESDEVVDVVLLWWRESDGDLVDTLMDAVSPLADDGVVWVLTPKNGRVDHVEPSEIAESATTAGLTQTSAANLGDWIGSRLVQPKTGRPRR